jgi:hypothetical protein
MKNISVKITKLIYLTFIHCACKSEKHKQCFLSLNCEQTFPNKKHKKSYAHEKHKHSPSENINKLFKGENDQKTTRKTTELCNSVTAQALFQLRVV